MSGLKFLFLSLLLSACRGLSGSYGKEPIHARSPPRGWNSYDSFSWIISEEEFLQNAEIVSSRLHAYGYEYVVVDYLWYRRKVDGAYADSLGFDVIDEWGRMQPDPERWPSSKGGKGFTEIANKVHSMGLKFGIHVMRGISTQAVNANTPILDTRKGGPYQESGREWRAQDIGIKERPCPWMKNGFMGVNTNSGAGRAFLRSLYEQYAEWGVDFVKHDCVFGDDLDREEVSFVSEVLNKLSRPIVYSLSPGTSVTPAMARQVNGLVNMYRVTADDWDSWRDIVPHFNISRDLAAAKMIGSGGLQGKSWPDLDMLPLGWLTDPGSNEGPHRMCNLTLDEQRTQVTLWAMAKSPLMFGGDLRKLDDTTYNLITNPTILRINSFSSDNMEFPHITSSEVHGMKQNIYSRDLTEEDTLHRPDFGLTSCGDSRANVWSVKTLSQDVEQICWEANSGNKFEDPLCLVKRNLLVALDEQTIDKYQGKLHLLASDRRDFCLDASPKRKEFKRGSFSPCRLDENQMWELNSNGTLRNSYSGLCAVVDSEKGGVRSWIATGKGGRIIYVAFFNLEDGKRVISAKISDLATALPRAHLKGASCKCGEVWSGKDFGVVNDSMSMEVEAHGCALFVLNYCSPRRR
ncbi:probable alpha-galactosidase D isoform X2 [Carica papaya]|uniref:probable alpha-galactosidase D isoform X2 n=1 Tax=Carica papaya TaxID=3649 RepID=UPI000B8CB62C|nr:probable alpha-galactosidase D isoform X2 [Carica papaya]